MQGDDVEWAQPIDLFNRHHYDILYASKVFNFSPDIDFNQFSYDRLEKGGTGYDIYKRLPDEIDKLQPLYTMYPWLPKNQAVGKLTEGCPNKCFWCVVPKKEGRIRPYMDIEDIAIEGRTHVVLMDNNILAAGDYAKEQLQKIIDLGLHIDFNQAMDARLVTPEYAELLGKVKWIDSRIRFGCDTTAQIAECERAMQLINAAGFRGEYFLYTMIGGKTTSANATTDCIIGGNDCKSFARTMRAEPCTLTYSLTATRRTRTIQFPNGRRIWPDGATSE